MRLTRGNSFNLGFEYDHYILRCRTAIHKEPKKDGINLGKIKNRAQTQGTGSNAKITFDTYTVGRDPSVGYAVGKSAPMKYADGVTQDQARAVLVLHELAHATGSLKYSGGAHRGRFGSTNLPQPDSIDTGAIEANRRIYETCIK